MKRDLDLVRKILFKMDEDEETYLFSAEFPPEIEGYHEEQIKYHLKIMAQAGLLHVDTRENTPVTPHIPNPQTIVLTHYSISWKGHEFLSAIQDETVWNEVKKKAGKIGGFLYDGIIRILAEMGRQAVHEAMTPR